MSNLALIIEQIKNEITVDATGKGKASIRAVARLMDIDHAGLLGNLKSGEQNPSKLSLILTESGFDSGEQSLWIETGIPDLAIAVIAKYYAYKAGRYCKRQAELVDTAFTGIGVRAWLQQQVGWKQQETTQSVSNTNELAPAMITEIALAIFKPTGLSGNLVAGYVANEIGKALPQYRQVVESFKQSIPDEITEDRLLRPTQLAEIYEAKYGVKLSAQKMNILLESNNLQYRNTSGKNPNWLPTKEGEKYSKLVLDTARGHNKTVQSLQWYPNVVDILQES